MNSLWPLKASGDGQADGKQTAPDVPDTGVEDIGPDPGVPPRPLLQRTQIPAPQEPPPAVPSAPPAPNAPGDSSQPQDSLSLAQLRRIVAEFPRSEPIAYDYVYSDMGPIQEEIDEWFMYNFWQWVRLNAANRAFHSAWGRGFGQDLGWDDVDGEPRRNFIRGALGAVQSSDKDTRGEGIGALVYLVLGRWTETVRGATVPSVADGKVKSAATEAQLAAMKAGVQLLSDCGGIPVIWEALRNAFEPFWADEVQQNLQFLAEELIHLMTIMYIALQETLDDPDGMASVRSELLTLNPSLVQFMLHATARLRWDEACVLPQTQVFLLFWKSILLVFGGSKEIAATKTATREQNDIKEKGTITASPLDYHVFRQEITSKYPSYVPPLPAIPLDAEQTSILPQLPNHPIRNTGNGILPGPPGQSGGASILHQPVHIATPAPSPPPSPAAGGKGGKKQNYQTNQNFPFMYPPLDASSNSAGGKGGAGLQDLLVGRKWEGSDVPASILEAGELFSRRVKMTRATRQLWDERERFLKFERGWDGADDDIIDELDLSSLTLEEKEELGLLKSAPEEKAKKADPEIDYGPREVDQRTRERLKAVENFYSEALPHLQSLVIVLLKAIVAIASNLAAPQANGQQQAGAAGQNNGRSNGGPGAQGRAADASNGVNGAAKADVVSPSDNDMDESRSREIAAKAVTGILVLLLKWLKLSHVLKFEYLTQLLLDSNYLPLVLKLFALHDIQQVVESKTDRIEHSFFYFCGSRAGAIPNTGVPNPAATEFEDMSGGDDDDDSVPPPIKRRRSPTGAAGGDQPPSEAAPAAAPPPPAAAAPTRPEVDEMGYPVNPLPSEPITDFSRRNFFSLINYLRIMQKICKHKAHRNLLLVHYKSSNILRKSLKVPQQELRLYTLKLFKNQVPWCGRKWRQSNMRVITAIYLHCRPELRDEWLAGSDVDAEVEEALPLEQALRSITHWFNMRRYPEKMGAEVRVAMREEQDFFVRELDKMDLNWAEVEGDDSSVRLEWGE
ncbi:protein required for hyphal anastomosis [Podospora appendiculata]|uniref:Protein required for hyphal anastomosis n=1 Tax=Podospora appendiculata TaxID=314037 RepID=A0AAE1CAD3_9PEZI|nr:protein required for hyphal anastomosis [Podospora appendiculata]